MNETLELSMACEVALIINSIQDEQQGLLGAMASEVAKWRDKPSIANVIRCDPSWHMRMWALVVSLRSMQRILEKFGAANDPYNPDNDQRPAA